MPFIKGYKQSDEQKRKLRLARLGKPSPKKGIKTGKPSWNKGLKMSPEFGKHMSEIQKGKKLSPETIAKLKGKKAWNKGKKAPLWIKLKLREARKGIKLSDEHKKHISDGLRRANRGGANCNFWKGGVYPEHKAIRKSFEYRLWRKSVFERDRFTCIWCGAKGKLQADHIKSFSQFPELRFAIDNGRTLCFSCHQKTDNYGGRANRKL